jgi:hypothetical protein
MIRTERQLIIPVHPERAWPCLVVAEQFVRWSPVEAMRWLGEGPAVGARFELDERMLGRTSTYACTVTEYEPGRLFAYRADGGFVKVQASYRLEPDGAGCRCTIAEAITLGGGGASAVLGWLGAGWLLGLAVAANLRRLEGLVASEGQAAAGSA